MKRLFAIKMESEVLAKLKRIAVSTKRTMTSIIEEAINQMDEDNVAEPKRKTLRKIQNPPLPLQGRDIPMAKRLLPETPITKLVGSQDCSCLAAWRNAAGVCGECKKRHPSSVKTRAARTIARR